MSSSLSLTDIAHLEAAEGWLERGSESPASMNW
jgi:hypothetical protein